MSVMTSVQLPTGVSPQHLTVENVQLSNPALELQNKSTPHKIKTHLL